MSINFGEYFDTLLPGGVFLLFWLSKNATLKDFLLSLKGFVNNEIIFGFILLFISLFLGFVMHGMWRTSKYVYLKHAPKENESLEYNNKAFLYVRERTKLADFFSTRATIWGTSMIGVFVSFFIVPQYFRIYFLLIIMLSIMYYYDRKKEKDTIKRMVKIIKNES